MNDADKQSERIDQVKKIDSVLDKGFRIFEWCLFAFFVGAFAYLAFVILGVLEKPALVQWGGAAIIGLVGGWLIMKILKVLSWFGFG